MAQQEIKMKFNRLINMLKTSAAKEEKTAELEQKRAKEIEEVVEEFAKKKREGLSEIKDRFNELALKVKVDASAV